MRIGHGSAKPALYGLAAVFAFAALLYGVLGRSTGAVAIPSNSGLMTNTIPQSTATWWKA